MMLSCNLTQTTNSRYLRFTKQPYIYCIILYCIVLYFRQNSKKFQNCEVEKISEPEVYNVSDVLSLGTGLLLEALVEVSVRLCEVARG